MYLSFSEKENKDQIIFLNALRKSIKKIEQRNNSVDFCISNENSFIEKH
jgi:hypothetical protein